MSAPESCSAILASPQRSPKHESLGIGNPNVIYAGEVLTILNEVLSMKA